MRHPFHQDGCLMNLNEQNPHISEKFKRNKWRLCDLVAGDSRCFYYRHIGKKNQLRDV